MNGSFKNLLITPNPPPVRRREKRFLLLAVLLGLGFAVLFGLALYFLYRYDRL